MSSQSPSSSSSRKENLRGKFCSSSSTSTSKSHPQINNMCSVLNVVIDHTMESVTPMEGEEWKPSSKSNDDGSKEKDDALLVPVIRVFGPLLRDPHSQPLQSACMYIHGAFPYILARPVVAGPDGSIYPVPATTTHVDWDDRDEVEKIQIEIQATLEETLQSSFLDQRFGDKKDDKDKQRQGRHCPIIRRVTVVEGRGFYSFCPGPSTVFLRIGKFVRFIA